MKLTLLRDPHDCGLRESPGEWRCAPEAFRRTPHEFPRVTREREEELLRLFEDMVPVYPGEWSVVSANDVVEQEETPPGCPQHGNDPCDSCYPPDVPRDVI